MNVIEKFFIILYTFYLILKPYTKIINQPDCNIICIRKDAIVIKHLALKQYYNVCAAQYLEHN